MSASSPTMFRQWVPRQYSFEQTGHWENCRWLSNTNSGTRSRTRARSIAASPALHSMHREKLHGYHNLPHLLPEVVRPQQKDLHLSRLDHLSVGNLGVPSDQHPALLTRGLEHLAIVKYRGDYSVVSQDPQPFHQLADVDIDDNQRSQL